MFTLKFRTNESCQLSPQFSLVFKVSTKMFTFYNVAGHVHDGTLGFFLLDVLDCMGLLSCTSIISPIGAFWHDVWVLPIQSQ